MEVVLLHNWREEWLRHYDERRYIGVDPTVLRIAASGRAFTWRVACRISSKSPLLPELIAETAAEGAIDGLHIPIRFAGTGGGVVVSSARNLDLDREMVAALHTIGLFCHDRALRLSTTTAERREAEAIALAERHRQLAGRELDCLHLIADGQTSVEIATRFGIARKTVDLHLDNARENLGAANRAHLVATALRRRLI